MTPSLPPTTRLKTQRHAGQDDELLEPDGDPACGDPFVHGGRGEHRITSGSRLEASRGITTPSPAPQTHPVGTRPRPGLHTPKELHPGEDERHPTSGKITLMATMWARRGLTREVVRPHLSRVTVAPITSTIRGLSTEVPVGPANGLDHDSVVSCDNIVTVPVRALGRQVTKAIRAAFDLD